MCPDNASSLREWFAQQVRKQLKDFNKLKPGVYTPDVNMTPHEYAREAYEDKEECHAEGEA